MSILISLLFFIALYFAAPYIEKYLIYPLIRYPIEAMRKMDEKRLKDLNDYRDELRRERDKMFAKES